MGIGEQVTHVLGDFGVADLHEVIQVRRQDVQRRLIGYATGHAVGQQRADRGFHHAAGGQRIRIGGGVAADHAEAGVAASIAARSDK